QEIQSKINMHCGRSGHRHCIQKMVHLSSGLMLFRSSLSGALLLICLGLCGCYQGGEGQVDELKNPYFIAGKERAAERDYKGAIDAFEKALESNSRSAQAHFELGVLYELHSDQKEEDYV